MNPAHVLPLAMLAAPLLYALAAPLIRRCLARCAVSFPGPDTRALRCSMRFQHGGRHLHTPTGRTWPNAVR